MDLNRVRELLSRVTISCLGTQMCFRSDYFDSPDGRFFLQVIYFAPCTKTGVLQQWHGAKWDLSKHMTDDEIIKKAYVAFESCVKHEIMENFKVDGIILFNPHVNFEELLKISHLEIKRN